VTDADAEFIEQVYFGTRREEFAALGWAPEQLEMFLRMQLNFQQQSFRMQFPEADSSIIVFENERVGRLIVERTAKETRIIDIAVLPECRSRGIGTEILRKFIEDAKNEDKKIALNVLKTNVRAFNLYQKLGFVVTGDDEMYYSMEQ